MAPKHRSKKKQKKTTQKSRSKFPGALTVLVLVGIAIWFFWPGPPSAPTLSRPMVDGVPTEPPNIIMIVVDTLRADHLGIYGYHRPTSPNIDRIFGSGKIYEAAYAPTSFTPPSVMSILSGVYPLNHRVRMAFQKCPEDTVLFPQILKSAGYHTAAVVSNMILTNEAMGIGSRFDYFDDFVDKGVPIRGGYERDAERTTDAALEWLNEARFLKQPHFLWLHYMDPHGPYTPPEDKPLHFDHETPIPVKLERIPKYNRLDDNTNGAFYVDRYDEEIAYADREIGRFLDIYEQQGLLENAIVLFIADHGESLLNHEQLFTHGWHVYEETVRVPWLMLAPNQTGGRIKTPISLVDVAPTLLDMVGFDNLNHFDGRSLLGEPNEHIFLEGLGLGRGKQYRGLIQDQKKWVIYSENGTENPQARIFFDLAKDPLELNPLSWEEAGPAPKALIHAFNRDPDPSGLPRNVIKGNKLQTAKTKPEDGLPVIATDLDEETLEKLRALGYIQ